MSHLLEDPMFFYAVAFVIFIALAYRFGRAGFLGWIDGEIAKVRHQLDEAQKLRAEAEATLVKYKVLQVEAAAGAEAMIRDASQEAVRLKAQAEADLKASLAHHEQQASERIRLAEAAALAEVRQRGIDMAMAIARQTLEAKLQGEAAAKLVDQAIADLPASGPSGKAKAA